MKTLWRRRVVGSSASVVWELLTDLDHWPGWGPTVRRAELTSGRFAEGATGTITTIAGIRLGFEITAVEPDTRWTWTVAGVPATDHHVVALGPSRCRVGFGVPWVAAPYLSVCEVALRRLERLAIRSPPAGERSATLFASRESEG